MSTEPSPSTNERARPAAESRPPLKKKKKSKKAPKISRPLDEREINVPDKQTLIMMGVLSGLALVLWIFAHAACNYHPPRETRRPRSVTLSELTRDPKGAAIEMQQRLVTLDHTGALEIAAGPLKQEIEKEKASCDADRAACEARKKLHENAMTMAVVLERQPANAKVRVSTHGVPEGPKRFLVLVERESNGWKVTARVPDAPGAELPAPAISPVLPSPGDASQPLKLPPGHP